VRKQGRSGKNRTLQRCPFKASTAAAANSCVLMWLGTFTILDLRGQEIFPNSSIKARSETGIGKAALCVAACGMKKPFVERMTTLRSLLFWRLGSASWPFPERSHSSLQGWFVPEPGWRLGMCSASVRQVFVMSKVDPPGLFSLNGSATR